MRLHQCEWSCVRIIRPTTSLSRQGEKKDDTSWYFQMNLAFRSYHPAAGEEDGENILRRSLCRRLIFYFSDIPTSEDTVIPGCHGVMKSALDQWLHNKDGGGGGAGKPMLHALTLSRQLPWESTGSRNIRARSRAQRDRELGLALSGVTWTPWKVKTNRLQEGSFLCCF